MDEIDRLNNLMGEDGEDEDDGPLQEYGGIQFEPMPEVRDRPAADPLNWKAFEAKYGKGTRPYQTPLEEFIQNKNFLNLHTLLHRWKGFKREKEIFEIFHSKSFEALAERDKAQAIRKRQMCVIDPKDKEDIRIETAYHIRIVKERIEQITTQLEGNFETVVEMYFNPVAGGTSYKEKIRPLSDAARMRLDRDLMKWMDKYRLLTGQSLGKKEVEHTGSVDIRSVLKQQMKEDGWRTMGGMTLEELDQQREKLSLPQPIEGEIVEPVSRETEFPTENENYGTY